MFKAGFLIRHSDFLCIVFLFSPETMWLIGLSVAVCSACGRKGKPGVTEGAEGRRVFFGCAWRLQLTVVLPQTRFPFGRLSPWKPAKWSVTCTSAVSKSLKRRSGAFYNPSEEQEHSPSASSVLLLLSDGFFLVCWRRRRSHGKASSSSLSREAGSGGVRRLESFNTSLLAHLSHGRTA